LRPPFLHVHPDCLNFFQTTFQESCGLIPSTMLRGLAIDSTDLSIAIGDFRDLPSDLFGWGVISEGVDTDAPSSVPEKLFAPFLGLPLGLRGGVCISSGFFIWSSSECWSLDTELFCRLILERGGVCISSRFFIWSSLGRWSLDTELFRRSLLKLERMRSTASLIADLSDAFESS